MTGGETIDFNDDIDVDGDISASGAIKVLGEISSSGNIIALGNISGSTTSTGSFGELVVDDTGSFGRGYFQNSGLGVHISSDGDASLPSFNASTRFAITQTANNGGFNGMTVIGGNSTGASLYKFGDVDNEQIGRFVYYHQHNRLDTFVNNSHAMSIDSSQRVGIGHLSPTAPLHVSASTSDTIAIFQSGDSTARIQIQDNDTTNHIVSNNSTFSLGANNTLHAGNLNITSDGDVGLGTIAPSEKLDVVGNIKARDKVSSTTFESGFAGSGWRIESGSSKSSLTVDDLTVRSI